jgi:hypothetical protein
MLMDEIQRQINSIKDSGKKIIIKRIWTKSNIKTKYQGIKLKK